MADNTMRQQQELTAKYKHQLTQYSQHYPELDQARQADAAAALKKYNQLIDTQPFEAKRDELTQLVNEKYEIRSQQLIAWIKNSSFYLTVYQDLDAEALRKVNLQGILFAGVIEKVIRGLELCQSGRDFLATMTDIQYAKPNNQTINDEQDATVLSRFTQVDLTIFKQDQMTATHNRAVPFKDVFGYVSAAEASPPSQVLEFRFSQGPLPDFESVEAFKSRQADRKTYALHVNDLYGKGENATKASSSAIVLEDTFGIAEELNAQRAAKLNYFNEKLPATTTEEITEIDFDVNKQQQYYARRAEQMLAMINPELQRKFEYYQKPMFKKRVILQLIDSYRSGIANAYDNQIAEVEKEVLSTHDNFRTTTVDYLRQKQLDLHIEKKKKLATLDERLDQGKITTFNTQSEAAYNKVVEYYKKYSLDYLCYVRWLFGCADFVSSYAQSKLNAVNQVPFWQREFDFSTVASQINHINDITNILLDISSSDINLAEDNALWDELLSNPGSIHYIIYYLNLNGIALDVADFEDIKTGSPYSWRDVLDKTTNFGAVYNAVQEGKASHVVVQKHIDLYNNHAQVVGNIEAKKTELSRLESQLAVLNQKQAANQNEYNQVKSQHKTVKSEITRLNQHLQTIEQQRSSLTASTFGPNQLKVDQAKNYLFEMATKKQVNLIKHPDHQPINANLHRLHIMHHLSTLTVYPVELTIQIRPKSIEPTFAMLTEMQGEFFRQNGFSVNEQAFLQQFQVVEQAEQAAGHNRLPTKTCKLTLCFPEHGAMALFATFINKQGTTLSAHDLKHFIKNDLSGYFRMQFAQNQISQELSQLKSQHATLEGKLKQANLDKQSHAELQERVQSTQSQIKQSTAQLTEMEKRTTIQTNLTELKTARSGYQLNLKINALVGLLTLWNIWDNVKDWGKPVAGDGEMAKQNQLIVNITSLGLMMIDLTTQYQDIQLKIQHIKTLKSGASTAVLDDKIKLNRLLGKSVALIFAGITIAEAATELASAVKMRDMESSGYFYARSIGSALMIFGAVLLLITNPITLIVGVIALIAGTVLTGISKKYDNFTPIEHWLNRCYFGLQEELKYLQYKAYHEEDSQSLAGFGQAINDYLLIAAGIESFVCFKPLQAFLNNHDYTRKVQFYLNIPDFAMRSKAEYLKVYIRLFAQQRDGVKKSVDLMYTISAEGIHRQPTFMVIDSLPAKHITEGTDYILLADPSQSTQHIHGLNLMDHDISQPDEFSFTTEKLAGTDSIKRSELTIKKQLAGTYDLNRISYQLIIYYYNRDSLPLIMTQNSNKIADLDKE